MIVDKLTEDSISEARDIIESFDPSAAMTVGFDEPEYIVTRDQMIKIAQAIYLADCLVCEVKSASTEIHRNE